jgi:hypothetical protein
VEVNEDLIPPFPNQLLELYSPPTLEKSWDLVDRIMSVMQLKLSLPMRALWRLPYRNGVFRGPVMNHYVKS